MSRDTYLMALSLGRHGPDVEALIMAAMRAGNEPARHALEATFPGIWAELQARMLTVGGVLSTDNQPLGETHE